MRVFFYHLQSSGVGYYRAEVPARGLIAKGLSVDQWCSGDEDDPLADPSTAIPWLRSNIHLYDVLHVSYGLALGQVELLVAARELAKAPMVVDIDDDIYNVPAYNLAYSSYQVGAAARRVARMHLRVADAVTASTPSLSTLCAVDNRHIVEAPNCLIPQDWEHPSDPLRARDKSIRFLFSGNLGRYGDLAEVQEAFESAMRSYPQLRLFFMGCVPDWALQWMSSTTDPRANRAFGIPSSPIGDYRPILRWLSPDVIFAPVACNPFNKSKSCIKAFDAAMTGAAFLCTDWETYSPIPSSCAIKVSNTTDQWREAIGALVEDPTLRTSSNSKLREWALDTQQISSHIGQWISCYEQVISKGPVSSLADVVRPQGAADELAGRAQAGLYSHQITGEGP